MSAVATPTPNATLTPGAWAVDPSHSAVSFSVRHLMVSKVRGRFGAFTGTFVIGDDLLASSLQASVEMTNQMIVGYRATAVVAAASDVRRIGVTLRP